MPREADSNNIFSTPKEASSKLGLAGKWPSIEKVASMVREGSIADTVRTPLQFVDPAYFNPILFFIQHRDRKELNFRLRYEYEFHPLVHNVIDLHSQFPLSDFALVCGDSSTQRYYNDFKDQAELLVLLMDILKDYWLLGESFVHGHWDETNKSWKHFVMYPPEFIDVKGTRVTPEKFYFLEVDSPLKKLVQSPDNYDQELSSFIDPKMREEIATSGKIWLKPDQTFAFMHKTARYDLRGTSPVKSCYEDLLYEHKLRLLQFVIIDRHSYPLKIFKLGNPTSGWIPPQSHFETFRNLLASAANDPDFNIIFHHGLQVDYVGTKDKVMNLIPEFEFVESRILNGLFTNKAITHGDAITYSNSNVSVRILMHRYLIIRDMLALTLKNKIFRRIAMERGYYRSDTTGSTGEAQVNIQGKYKVLDLPKVKWRKLNLMDDTTQKNFLMKMREMQDIPHKILAEAMDLEAEDVVEGLKAEEGTVVDPIYQAVREKLSSEVKIQKQVLEGKKGHQYSLKRQKKDEDETSTEFNAASDSQLSPSVRPAPLPPTLPGEHGLPGE